MSNSFTKDDAQKTLETVNMLINNCDAKAATILSVIGVASSILLSSDIVKNIKIVVEKLFTTQNATSIILSLFFVASAIVAFVGAILLFVTISPKIVKKPKEYNKDKNLDFGTYMFFNKISEYTFTNYMNKVKNANLNEEEIINDLIFQIHSASQICASKYRSFKNGLWAFVVGFIIMAIVLIISYYII